MGVRHMQEACLRNPLKAYPEVQKIMHYKLYNCVRKHFRVSYCHELPAKNEPGYHPLQNVNWALGYLCSKAQLLWNPGEILGLDEDRVKSRLRHNAYKTRETRQAYKGYFSLNDFHAWVACNGQNSKE